MEQRTLVDATHPAPPHAWWDQPCVVCGRDLGDGIGNHRVSFSREGSTCNCQSRMRAKELAA